MGHWLEEAENKVSKRSNKRSYYKSRVDLKKSEIEQNRLLIEDDYLDVIDRFVSIIQRINNLPRNERLPFGQISSKQKENKLDNLLHKFASRRRLSITEFNGILSPFKSQRYKNSRSFFICISRELNSVQVEYKEIRSKKIRLNENTSKLSSIMNVFKKNENAPAHEVLEHIDLLPLSKFSEDFILEHIDWLAFRIDSTHFLNSKTRNLIFS